MLRLEGHKKGGRCLDYSPDGRYLASGGVDGCVLLWDLSTGKCETIFKSKPKRAVLTLAFSPDRKTLGWGCFDTAYLWDLEAHRIRDQFPGHEFSVNAISFSSDGSVLAAVTKDFGHAAHRGEAYWWDTTTGRRRDDIESIFKPPRTQLPTGRMYATDLSAIPLFFYSHSIGFSPDGTTMAICADGLLLVDWPSCRPRRLVDIKAHRVCFSLDSTRLAAKSESKLVQLIDLSSPKAKPNRLMTAHTVVRAARFSPSMDLLLTVGNEGTVCLWDLNTLAEKARYDWKVGPTFDVAIAPDGMTAAVTGEEAIVVFDLM